MNTDPNFDETLKEKTKYEADAVAKEETALSSSDDTEAASSPEKEEVPCEEESCEKTEKKKENLSRTASFFDWIKSFLFSLTTVIFIFTLLFRGVTVNGASMLPTLHNKEYLIISNLFYDPKPGDIVVVQSPHYKNGTEPLIKRIIATEGQTVKINFATWEVWVDGELLEEDYILKDEYALMNWEHMTPNKQGFAETTVSENCIFVTP
jgi:signal peptidase I